MNDSPALASLAAALADGRVEVVDLAHTLSDTFPVLSLPPQFAQTWAFRKMPAARYDECGPNWYFNNFQCSEHTGTHFDAPAHWITGRGHAANTVDTIDAGRFIAPASVVDASARVALDPDWLLDVDDLLAWEERHGRIAAGSWLLLRTDWSRRIADPIAFVNLHDDGAHTPGPTQRAVQWLIEERDVIGFGVETINTDAGQSYAWPTPYPCHHFMHGANRFGLQCLTNLDRLPPTGALIVAAPLKIEAGSGSPLRALALVPRERRA